MINMTGKEIIKRATVIFAGLLAGAMFSGCSNNTNHAIFARPYEQASKPEINKFNFEQNLPKYELMSHRLGIVFDKNFKDEQKISNNVEDSDCSSYFKLDNNSNKVYFTDARYSISNSMYYNDVKSLHYRANKHTITFVQGNKNVTYKLYNLKNQGKRFRHQNYIKNKEIILIPIKERILGKHETNIPKKQGKHYLAYIKETTRLSHTSQSDKGLPTD